LAHEVSGGRLLVFGGGGYEPRNVSRCWAVMFLTLAGVTPKDEALFKGLFDKDVKAEDAKILAEVRQSIRDVKETIFPLHNL
jgi:acetoin utilization deacetylase AcuC-like enzyme